MAPNNDSNESLASPDDRENLPGELLGEDLVEPGSYQVSADETEAEELSGADESDDDTEVEVDDAAQLAQAETVAQKARSSRPVRKGSAPVVAAPRKGAPKPRGGAGTVVASRPAGPVQFATESVEELRKVVWPTWSQVQQYFWAVLVFVLVVIAYVGLLDLGFGWLLLKLFG